MRSITFGNSPAFPTRKASPLPSQTPMAALSDAPDRFTLNDKTASPRFGMQAPPPPPPPGPHHLHQLPEDYQGEGDNAAENEEAAAQSPRTPDAPIIDNGPPNAPRRVEGLNQNRPWRAGHFPPINLLPIFHQAAQAPVPQQQPAASENSQTSATTQQASSPFQSPQSKPKKKDSD